MSKESLDLNNDKSDDFSYEPQLMPVDKPWYIYLIAIWAFIGIGGFLMSLSRVFSRINPQVGPLLSIIELIFVFVLIINILKMNKAFLILNGVVCISIALLRCVNLFALLSKKHVNSVFYLILLFIVPHVVIGILSIRPKLLSIADQYSKYRGQEMMRKASLKYSGTK